MAINIGNSGGVTPTTVPPAEQDLPKPEDNTLARQGAKDAQKAHAKTELQKEGDAKSFALKGEARTNEARFKDALVSDNGATLLEALAAAVGAQSAPDPKGHEAGLSALTTVKPLLGKPNGLPVPDAPFEHKELEALAAMPAGISAEATETLVSLTAPQNAPSTETTEWFSNVLEKTGALTQAKSETALKIKDTISYINKLRAMTEKLAQPKNDLPPPHLPAAVAKLIVEKLPELQAATKALWKTLDGQAKKSDDIEIPSDVVVQLEKAILPGASKYRELMEKLQAATATPQEAEELALALSAEQAGKALSPSANKFTGLAKELVLVKPDKDWKLTQIGVGMAKHFVGLGSNGSSGGTQGSPAPLGGTKVGKDEVLTSRFSGLDYMTADLESLIYFVMMQATASEGEMLRDQMIEIRNTNKQKEEMRNKLTKMKKEKAECETAMRNEYDYLVSQGAISGEVDFESYKEWRQVTWTPEGDAALQQPMPALPDHFIFGPDGPPQPPEGSAAQGAAGIDGMEGYPALDAQQREALAAKYGCDEADVAYLHSYYQWCMQNGSTSFGLDGAAISAMGFEGFLQHMGLTEGADNQAQVDALMGNQIKSDTPLAGEEATSGASQATPTTVSEVKGKSKDALSEELFAMLTQPPYSENAELQLAIESIVNLMKEQYPIGLPDPYNPGKMLEISGSALVLKMAFAAMYSPAFPTGDPTAKLLATHFAHLQSAIGQVDASLGLKPPGSVAMTMFTGLSEKVLADVKYFKTHVIAENPFEVTPFNPFVCLLGNAPTHGEYHESLGEVGTVLFDGGMAALNAIFNTETIAEMEKRAIDQAYADAVAGQSAPNSDVPFGQAVYDQWLLAQQAENEAEAAAEEARRAAEEAVANAQNAAKEGTAALQGSQSLNSVEGAQTGSLASLDAAIEENKNKLDSLSELNELGSMRLQMLMERRQKMLETLSNVMKKMSATKETINQNMKG